MKKNDKEQEKKISDYKCLDDWFVDKYLRKEGETIEEAKIRVKKMQEETKIEKNKKSRKNNK